MCCGCTACQQICPKNCIEMVRDNEGFLYPKINRNNCIYCGLCERACPEISPFDIVSPIDCYAAKSSDETIRKESSSGGDVHSHCRICPISKWRCFWCKV
ncbi:4Fe-4S dicluster domain-containing protein [Xylanibacter rodentium]